MKRLLCLLLSMAILLSFPGCGKRSVDAVSFYYSRDPSAYQYYKTDSVIVSEARDLTEHRNDMRYILGLYLAGPIQEGLISVFPSQVRLLSVSGEGTSLKIELSDLDNVLSDALFSLGCACLTLTCLDVSVYTHVTVVSGSRTLTMNADSLLLYDAVSAGTQETEVTK